MKKHGLTGTRIYGIWRAMMKRCYKTWHHAYPKYGGRGIIVDPSVDLRKSHKKTISKIEEK